MTPNPPPRRRRTVVLAGSIAAALGLGLNPAGSRAANTWDGGGANGNWNTALNWDTDTVPAFPQALTFAGAANLTTTNDLTGITVDGITFDATAGAFKLQGNAVTLGGAITSNSTETQTINLPLVLLATQSVNALTGNMIIGPGASGIGVISGAGGLTKTGPGTLTLGAMNTYIGDTILDGGTLAYAVDNSVTNLIWGTPAATPYSTTASSVDLTNASLTAASLNVRVNTTSLNTITIGAGKTLTVTGQVTVGPNTSGLTTGQDSTGVRTFLTVAGEGSLVVNTTSNFTVGMPRLNADPGGDPQATVDLSPLNSFTYNAGSSTGELRVGFGGNLQGTLRLAATSNMITARVIQVGNSNNQNNGGTSLLALGGGTNQIQANTITIGSGKSPAIFNFQGINGSITIAGQTAATADIAVGTASSATASTTVSTMNFDGHLANVQAGTLIVGRLSGSTAGLGGGSVAFDTGLFNVANLQMAVHSSGGTNATTSALLTIGGPFPNDTATGIFNVASQFLLVNRTSAAGTTATSTLTVNGGTANIGADILIVDNSPAAARNTTFNLAGGTLNMMGHGIATAALPVSVVNLPGFGQMATLANLGGTGVNGAGLNMNGAGTLILSGANTYTGATTVTGGTLAVSGTLSGTTAVNVTGGTLRLGGNDPINDAGTLTLGDGTFDSGGFSDTLGTFTLSGAGVLDLGTGASALHFADSSNNLPAWTGTLSIANWSGSSVGGGTDQVFFSNNGSGLAAAQVARITFVNPFGPGSGNTGAKILSTGEIVAIPEPGSFGLLAAALAATAALGRRHSRRG